MKKNKMTEFAFSEFKKETKQEADIILKMANLLKQREAQNRDFLTKIQEFVISYGERLENLYGFRDTAVIQHMEQCCEKIYQLSEAIGSPEDLEKQLELIDEKINESVETIVRPLSIGTIIKNEARYLPEWIEYHRLAGISFFYLYDNGSTDNTMDVLADYIEEGIVDYTFYPGYDLQMEALTDIIRRFCYQTDYLAVIDVDEYIISTEGKKLPQVLKEIIEEYEQRTNRLDIQPGGIAANWKMFGTSGHKEAQKGLLTETYLYRANDRYDENAHIKTICNPRAVTDFSWTAHIPSFKPGYAGITENGSYLINCHVFFDARYDRLQINHYYTKSEEEFREKIVRNFPQLKEDEDYFRNALKRRECCNDIYDPIMLRYTSELKERLARRNHFTEGANG